MDLSDFSPQGGEVFAAKFRPSRDKVSCTNFITFSLDFELTTSMRFRQGMDPWTRRSLVCSRGEPVSRLKGSDLPNLSSTQFGQSCAQP